MSETRWNLTWADRPPEEARNFNAAFCAELIGRTVSEFYRARQASLNVATAFLVLPLVLHKPTRIALPSRANTTFSTWIADNNPRLAELPERVNRLRPVTREALLFAIRHRLLALSEGELIPGTQAVPRSYKPSPTTEDVAEARACAALLGRWFGNQATQTSILLGMGVAP